jgi:YbbR domain-containing protein
MNFLRRLPRALLFLGREGLLSIVRNLGLALLSIVLAVALWLFVIDRQNPQETQAFGSSIPITFVNVPTDLAVANTSETTVRVRVQGPHDQLKSLVADDFTATVNLGGFQKGQVSASVEVNTSNGRVDVTEVTPGRVDVSLEPLRTNVVPVHVSMIGSPQQGFAATGQESDPIQATVSGPESLVGLVDSVVAEVNLTGLRSDFTDRIELQPRDVRGGAISRVTVNPDRARVTARIQQQDFSQDFVVSPVISGNPAAGYNVGSISVEPAIVIVSGPLDVLQSIDAVRGIQTSEISVTDARSDVQRTVQLTLPSGVRLQAGTAPVRVTVSIKPAIGEAAFRVVPQVRNIGAGLALTPPDGVTITLAGDLPTLDALTPEAIVAFVDASGQGAGLVALPLQVTPPAGTTVIRTDPGEVGIALTTRPG